MKASLTFTAIVFLGCAAALAQHAITAPRALPPSSTAATTSSSSVPTFNRDVLPILEKHCQSCHRPGEGGPMSFLTYESTRPWAKAIRTAVITRKMPPWPADSRYGHFLNDHTLNQYEIDRLAEWAQNGAPEGDAKDKPAAV